MSRQVEFEEYATCENCGEKGAYDFMGDILCEKCSKSDQMGAVQNPDTERQAREFWERVYCAAIKSAYLSKSATNIADAALAEWRKRWGGEK